MKTIFNISAVLLAAAMLFVGCVKESLPESGSATKDQVSESFAADNIAATISTAMITQMVISGSEHIDFGYPGIMGATDRLTGDVFPTSVNMQYADRWQPWQYPDWGMLNNQSTYCTFTYYNYFKFIKTANDVLTLCDPELEIDPTRGMAKAFRAMFYLDMARMYDPLESPGALDAYNTAIQKVAELTVPQITETMTEDEMRNNPRLTREAMFNFIFDDLNDAEKCLAEYSRASAAYPSLAVIYGLKARAYLWLGGFSETYENFPTGVAAYKKAAEYARLAITTSGATMMTEDQWTSATNGFNTVVSSWMWAMIQSADSVINNLLSWSAHMANNAVYGYGFMSQPGLPSYLYDRINPSDFRKKLIVGPDMSYDNIKKYTTLTEEEFGELEMPYAFFKFKTAGGEKTNYTAANVTSIPLMRVEEMLLIEAEATAYFDNGAARELLTSFMAQRAPEYKIPASTTDIVEEIIFQKRIEFWGEGIIFYDFKRLNMPMLNGEAGTNAPSGARYTTEGRAPWWNLVIPLQAMRQNQALMDTNNPNPTNGGYVTVS